MKYTFSVDAPQQQFISITLELTTPKDSLELQLPAWRPGRYELGNFAKNVKSFSAYNEKGKVLPFFKETKDKWIVDTSNAKSVKVTYKYYAAELNAGSSFLDETQLYVNPVNCCFYTTANYSDEIEVVLEIPESWKVASPILVDERKLLAKNFDQLADSPFICSAGLQHASYQVKQYTFHIWFNGLIYPDWNRLLKDFGAFTEKQLDKFLEFPCIDYHFLIQILPYQAYHGVEHERCTVITLGPSYDIFGRLYKELLGVSSHELYHTWNVKSIRPIEMMPYDFSKENYSKMGFLAEGVTTYMGDLLLMKSGVFDLNEYFNEFNTQLQRHFDNFGRFNYSVAESSFDTWLDGYTPGAPGRKVSIYTEGCLLAFVTDVSIMKATANKRKLDDVMRSLYNKYGKKGIGVSQADYKAEIANVSGTSMDWLFDQYINGTKAFEGILTDCLDYLGLELMNKPSRDYGAARLGVKAILLNNQMKTMAIFPGSPYDIAGGMLDDEIMAVNDVKINNDFNQWLEFFENSSKKITVNRKGRILELFLPEVSRTFYQHYWVQKLTDPYKLQRDALGQWRK